MLVVLSTFGSDKEAGKIAQKLVKEGLAACAKLLPVRSFFFWKKKFFKEREWLMLAVVSEKKYTALEKRLRQLHSYKVPEILALKIARGYGPYLKWAQEL